MEGVEAPMLNAAPDIDAWMMTLGTDLAPEADTTGISVSALFGEVAGLGIGDTVADAELDDVFDAAGMPRSSLADLTAIPSSVLVAQASPATTGVTHPDIRRPRTGRETSRNSAKRREPVINQNCRPEAVSGRLCRSAVRG